MTLKTLLIPLIAYIIILLLTIALSNFLIFLPPTPSHNHKDLIKLPLPNGLSISALYLFNPNAKFTILYSHGNAEDLESLRPRLAEYWQAGFSILAYDYPGYGASQGRSNETNVYQSIFAAYNYLTQDLAIPPSQIIAYGFSVGSGPSVELATQKPLAALILQSPFLSAVRVITYIKILPWDAFDNYKKIPNIKAPLLIFHGSSDDIIPAYHSKTLFEKAPQPKTYIEVPNADHNNFIYLAGPFYWEKLHKFTSSLHKNEIY